MNFFFITRGQNLLCLSSHQHRLDPFLNYKITVPFLELLWYHISLVIRQLFSFQKHPKDLDPSYRWIQIFGIVLEGWKLYYSKKFHRTSLDICSHKQFYKMDLDLWDCFGRVKLLH